MSDPASMLLPNVSSAQVGDAVETQGISRDSLIWVMIDSHSPLRHDAADY
jgi:hypothetical protein